MVVNAITVKIILGPIGVPSPKNQIKTSKAIAAIILL
jgi:hypothetical protein